MITYIVLSICVFISMYLLSNVAIEQASTSLKKYRETFTEVAEANMSDMFIFIEPQKLLVLNILLVFVTFFVILLFTGYWLLALIGGIIVGLSPKFLWEYLRNRRNDRFLMDLPDALTSMHSMMKAGTNLNVAIETVVAETKGPIGQEFGLFLSEVRMGVEFGPALDNFLKRMPLQELELVIAGMKINREIGGSLADVLYRLANTLRKKLEMEGKIKALTAQGKYQGYVMTSLPVMVAFALFQIEPVAMSYLFIHPIGWIVCTVFVVCQIIGYYFIRKIVNIDV
jgi:tight adherence protein B